MSELKDRIEGIFLSKLDGEPLVQTVGLKAVFKNQADLMSVMAKFKNETTGDFVYKHKEFCDLVDEQGVIAFVNATVSGSPNAVLSGSNSENGLSCQDVFHFDPFEVASLIYKPATRKRKVSTDYTYIDEVKKAIALLDQSSLKEDVVKALKGMADPSYFFELSDEERGIRNMILFRMLDFNQAVFDLIPADRKLRHEWTSDEYEVVAHSNKAGNILHGRSGGYSGRNKLIGMDVSP